MKNSKKWLRNNGPHPAFGHLLSVGRRSGALPSPFRERVPVGWVRAICLCLLFWPSWLLAEAASGGDYTLTKALVGASGVSQSTSADFNAAYAVGEDAAGTESRSADYDLVSGYFSGYASGFTGNFGLVNATVGPTKILQDGVQVGVPLNATIQLNFSSPLNSATIAGGIQVMLLMDHLGQSQNIVVPSTYTYAVIGTTVVISAQGVWQGNTLYDVVANTSLQSIDGFVLAQAAHTQFITVLDPNQENVVLRPIPIAGNAQSAAANNAPSLNLDIPTNSLSDYAYVLVSPDPMHSPLQVNPTVLQAATANAQLSGGAYQTPLALEEIAAYNMQGRPMSLGKSISFSMSYIGGQPLVGSSGAPIRAQTLSLWALDPVHALWVKMPDTHPNGAAVTGPVTQFSVYALMGSADGDASSVFVFPIPWRPHGSGAGTGIGQTGTDSGGITFSNLPSECKITIYTLSGNRVRELHHSDLSGSIAQEKWDGNTSSGDPAASGVYLWRVESTTDGINGKLMIIR